MTISFTLLPAPSLICIMILLFVLSQHLHGTGKIFGQVPDHRVELRRAKRVSGEPWVRFFGKSIDARNFGYDVTYVRPLRLSVGGGEAVQSLGTEALGQFSLAGNRVAALHLATRVFLAGNHVSDEQRDKRAAR